MEPCIIIACMHAYINYKLSESKLILDTRCNVQSCLYNIQTSHFKNFTGSLHIYIIYTWIYIYTIISP